MRAILERNPTASGVLFDLPHVIAECVDVASGRQRVDSGDFFVDPLPVADVYLLMEVIHDWTDDNAVKILGAVRRAAPSHARVLIIETIISDATGPDFGKTLDVIMLAVTGGRERTAQEYEALLNAAGFRLDRVIRTRSQHSVVEAIVE